MTVRTRTRSLALAALAALALACGTPGGKAGAEVTVPTNADPRPEETPASVEAAPAPAEPAPAPAEPAPAPSEPEPEPEPDPNALGVLTAEQKSSLSAGDEDPPIPVKIHYVQSNETRHDLYFPYIKDKGGAYIGVGSDMNYTMIAKARCSFAFLMDIDYRVVGLHRIYKFLIPRAESPDALIEYFNKESKKETETLLEEEAFADLPAPQRRRLIGGYRAARETVYRHLIRVRDRRPRAGVASTWLSDLDAFKHIQTLHEQDRIRVMSGNLTGEASLKTVARAADALGVKVSVLYMSNAEEYFMYTPEFVANIQGLPGADDAMVLRTIYSKKWPHADLWAYQVQPLSDMQERLKNRKNRGRNAMMRYAKNAGELEKLEEPKGLSLISLEAKAVGGDAS